MEREGQLLPDLQAATTAMSEFKFSWAAPTDLQVEVVAPQIFKLTFGISGSMR
jgi:hypothetical protein